MKNFKWLKLSKNAYLLDKLHLFSIIPFISFPKIISQVSFQYQSFLILSLMSIFQPTIKIIITSYIYIYIYIHLKCSKADPTLTEVKFFQMVINEMVFFSGLDLRFCYVDPLMDISRLGEKTLGGSPLTAISEVC